MYARISKILFLVEKCSNPNNKKQAGTKDPVGRENLNIKHIGVKINPEFWLINLENHEIESNQLPNSSLISLLKYSSSNKKVGETILLILMSLNGKNFNQLHPFFLQIAIISLNEIGLKEKAFDLAIETLIER